MSSNMERKTFNPYECPNFNLELVTAWSRRITDIIKVPTAERPKKLDDLDHAVAWLTDRLTDLEFHLPKFQGWDSNRCQQAILRWAVSNLKKSGFITWPNTTEPQQSVDTPKLQKQAIHVAGPANQASASVDGNLLRHMAGQFKSGYNKGFEDGYARAVENIRALQRSHSSSRGTHEGIDQKDGEPNLAPAVKDEDSS
ncbi:hypothetical protein BKA80DRAFT_343589 [Phyllosticta citrichinensis]